MSCSRSYLFERTEFFFKRLEVYTEARPTVAMTDIITKVMVEVLTIIGIATEEISRDKPGGFPTCHINPFSCASGHVALGCTVPI